MIRLAQPLIDDDDIAAVTATLRTGQFVQAQEVAAFEAELSAYLGGGNVVAVNSGTSALHLALLALDVHDGDEVVVPAYSWPATANVVVCCGARPVFVDIDQVSFAMNVDAVRKAIEVNRNVKAVLPVHPFGEMADMDAIVTLCAERNIPVIEDAACALGSTLDGRRAGRWGLLGCFSFHPRKAITTGEGGAVVTDEPGLARRVRMWRNHGIDPDAPPQDFVIAGLNQRMTELQASLGRSQLRKLDQLIMSRRQQAARYTALFHGSSLRTPRARNPATHVFQSYIVLLPEERAGERDSIIAGLRQQGVEASIGTHHIPLLRFYREQYGYGAGDFPITDMIARRAMALPLHASLTAESQDVVVERLRALVD